MCCYYPLCLSLGCFVVKCEQCDNGFDLLTSLSDLILGYDFPDFVNVLF